MENISDDKQVTETPNIGLRCVDDTQQSNINQYLCTSCIAAACHQQLYNIYCRILRVSSVFSSVCVNVIEVP